VRSRNKGALPLIMTHGWPGSIIEMLQAIDPLTNPTAHGGRAPDSFDVVLPSIPGYGFSGQPTEIGWDHARIGRAWPDLMHRLGYTRYVAPGRRRRRRRHRHVARQAPEGLIGIHLNLLVTALGGAPSTNTTEERAAAAALNEWIQTGKGYFIEQATRPRSGTPCWTHRSPWRPGCSTTTPTATTRSSAPSSAARPRATSPESTSSTTSRCAG
jgi:hypothetical protein